MVKAEFFCAECGRARLARRCGCQGAKYDGSPRTIPNILIPPGVRTESVQLLTRAAMLRDAAKINPSSAEANIADAERLERMAIQGRRA